MQSSVNKNESRTFFGHPYPLGSLFFTEMWERKRISDLRQNPGDNKFGQTDSKCTDSECK
jgi:hypothetical protein